MKYSETVKIVKINGPIVECENNGYIKIGELVNVGPLKLIGEIIAIDKDRAVVQVYDDTVGLMVNDEIIPSGHPLSVYLGPGLLTNIYSGIGSSLKVESKTGFIERGKWEFPLDLKKEWEFEPIMKEGDKVFQGQKLGYIQEYSIKHYIMVPIGVSGKIIKIKTGKITIDETLVIIKDLNGENIEVKGYTIWAVRKKRPVKKILPKSIPFFTGQRVLDFIFPIPLGGVAAIPGGFGAGKTVLQHSIAKWSNADIIIYVGCGERGNEIAQLLEEFPLLEDPKYNKPLMERTIIIANTSNMPVTAREASIYTGITFAEYYRDMGYNVTVLADSTSRWAEALREISSRMEEIPAEEGYPSYLASRLAEFYERAGYFETLAGDIGSITAIGAVSPQGGDFSEPVTQNTKRFIKGFWALDRNLSYAKHFPAISWSMSYSEYGEDLSEWWKANGNIDWLKLRDEFKGILLESDKLENIIKIVGFESLPDDEKMTYFMGDLIKKVFLQQDSYDKVDAYSSMNKQVAMANILKTFYDDIKNKLKTGVPFYKIKEMDAVDKLIKIKFIHEDSEEFKNTLDDILQQLEEL